MTETNLPTNVVKVIENQNGDGISDTFVFTRLPPTTPTLIDSLETRDRPPRKFGVQVYGLIAGIVYIQKSDDNGATWSNHFTITLNGGYRIDAVTHLRVTTTGVPAGALLNVLVKHG